MKLVSLAEVPVLGVSHDELITKQVMLKRGDVPHMTHFSLTLLSPGQTTSPHRHTDLYEGFFVASGSGMIKVENSEYPLESGLLIAIEPGELHEISNSSNGDLILIYFGIEA
jgi:mannose-6-phosphate isomerase-like protein (cupin superfamily)